MGPGRGPGPDPAAHSPPQPERVVGGAGEGVGRGRGRVKARRSPPPEGVTAYKKGAALGTGAAGGGGAARLRRAQAVPASRASHASHRSHWPGPRGRMSESKRRGRGRDPKHREGRKRERKQELLPGEEGRALPRRAQAPRFPGRNLPPAHPPPAPESGTGRAAAEVTGTLPACKRVSAARQARDCALKPVGAWERLSAGHRVLMEGAERGTTRAGRPAGEKPAASKVGLGAMAERSRTGRC